MRFLAVALFLAGAPAMALAQTTTQNPDRPALDERPADERPSVPSRLDTPAPAPTAANTETAPVVFTQIVVAVKQRSSDRRVGFTAEERAAVITAYEKRNAALWSSETGLSDRGKSLIAEIRRADEWGLPAAELEPQKLPGDGGQLTIEDQADIELRVSAAALKYARFARGGRIAEPTKQLASYIDRTPQLVPPADVMATLSSAGDAGAALRGFNPKHPAFEALRLAYVETLKSKASDGSDTIGDGPSLRPGMRHPHVAIARRLLKVPVSEVSADADGKPGDAQLMDKAMVDAVKAFQETRGQEPADGIIGRKTRAELNMLRGPSQRELLVNMEQWRWMPTDLGATHIAVNIPEFTIRLVKNGSVVHAERVVTGLVTNQTPVFSDMLKTVVLLPDWVLPESIKVKEAIPSLLGQGNMFWSNGLKIKKGNTPVDPRSVDWYSANQKLYTFYQPPGDQNVLGQVKFLFPNKHAVYFHDTPSKHLFRNSERAFSHGCIRVRNPVRLAELVLEHDKGWSAEKVRELLESGPEDNRVALDNPIPVHVTYFTVTQDENGKLRSLRDVYGHARRISLALDGRWGDIEIPEDHLAPIEDREFEWRTAAFERRRTERERRYESYNSDPIGNMFKSLFGN